MQISTTNLVFINVIVKMGEPTPKKPSMAPNLVNLPPVELLRVISMSIMIQLAIG
jgi:hypothetical protein